MMRMSPAQVPPLEGKKEPVGGFSVLHPLLLAAGLPYPPMALVEMVVFDVAGIAGEPADAGMAGVFVTVMVV